MDDDVDQFMAITGVAAEHVARGYLEISGGDPMQAIQLFFENPELQASFNAPAASASASASQRQPTSSAATGHGQAFTGRQDSRGIIHIDSDDDDDVNMADNEFTIPDDDDDDVAAVARSAQEEEDAAMARRLQEEMYSENHGPAGEGVRAPIAQTHETLAAPDPSWGLDDDREAAVMEQMRRRRRLQGKHKHFNLYKSSFRFYHPLSPIFC